MMQQISGVITRVERIDDVLLLVHQMKQMGLAEVLDGHLHPHGNWGEGLSLGETLVIWLAYLISEGDHRMCPVAGWVEGLLVSLRPLVSPTLRPEDLCDDRLQRALRYLAQDEAWAEVERALSERVIRVYALPTERVRVDMSTVSSYARVTPEGLVQFGFSKDHRPDVPQVKVGLAVLDPLAMPLCSLVAPGNRADDPCYVPLIQQAHQILGCGVLYVGDSKMAAAATRGVIHRQGNVYLCPAPRTVVSEETLTAYLENARAEKRMETWQLDQGDGTRVRGEAFVVEEQMEVTLEGERISWSEERLVIRSEEVYRRAVQRLNVRLAEAEAALQAVNARGRGKRRYRRCEALAERVAAIVERYGVEGVLQVTYRCEVKQRRRRGYRGQPARLERQDDWFVAAIHRDEAALQGVHDRLGWRIYLTNGKAQGKPMTVTMVVKAYRQQYRVERGFERIKDRPLGITPMYLHRDDHRKGLIRLFILALQIITVLEYEVRQALARSRKVLSGLYEGNPKRGTSQPTAERLLRAFKGLYVITLHWEDQLIRHVSALSDLQKEILHLLGFSESIYTGLATQFAEPP